MRRILLLLAVLLVTAAFAAPVSAGPDPCIINCYGINATSTSAQ